MLFRSITGRTEIVISSALHPHYKQVLTTYVCHLPGVKVSEAPLAADGTLDLDALKAKLSDKTSVFLLPTPNFFGCLERANEISALVHNVGALLVALVNPISLGAVQTPGSYNADFAVAEGQPLGNAVNFGGPGLGIMTAKKMYMRQLPGRIVGIAKDKDGKRSFVLTLQAREQHIRREKASSNICSNEALCALTAGLYMATMGPDGMAEAAEQSMAKAHYLEKALCALPGVEPVYGGAYFHEFVLKIDRKSVV